MVEKIKFILGESFKTFKRYPFYSIIASLTIMICLIMVSSIIYLSNVINNTSDNFKKHESVMTIYLNSNISDAKSKKICNNIKEFFNLNYVDFSSKNDIFNTYKKSYTSNNYISIDDMPCLCKTTILDTEKALKIDSEIKSIYPDQVYSIDYPKSYLAKFDQTAKNFYSVIFIIGVIFFIVSIFNVSNIIRLSIDSRKKTIETLQLHGANRFFIKAPFIIEGMIQGIIGSILSSLIIWFIFNSLLPIEHNHFLANSLITTIPFKIYLFFNLIFGSILGFIGGNLGASNYLD